MSRTGDRATLASDLSTDPEAWMRRASEAARLPDIILAAMRQTQKRSWHLLIVRFALGYDGLRPFSHLFAL